MTAELIMDAVKVIGVTLISGGSGYVTIIGAISLYHKNKNLRSKESQQIKREMMELKQVVSEMKGDMANMKEGNEQLYKTVEKFENRYSELFKDIMKYLFNK